MLVPCPVHDLLAGSPVIGLRWLLVIFVGVAHDHNVGSAAEWVSVDLTGIQVGIRIAPLSLNMELREGRSNVLMVTWYVELPS